MPNILPVQAAGALSEAYRGATGTGLATARTKGREIITRTAGKGPVLCVMELLEPIAGGAFEKSARKTEFLLCNGSLR